MSYGLRSSRTRRRLVIAFSVGCLALLVTPLLEGEARRGVFRWLKGWTHLRLADGQTLTTGAGGKITAVCDLDVALPPLLARDWKTALAARPGEHFVFVGRVRAWEMSRGRSDEGPSPSIAAETAEYQRTERLEDGTGVILFLGTLNRAEFRRAWDVMSDDRPVVGFVSRPPQPGELERLEAVFGRDQVVGGPPGFWKHGATARIRYVIEQDENFAKNIAVFVMSEPDRQLVNRILSAPE